LALDKSILTKNFKNKAKGLEGIIFIAADSVLLVQDGLEKVINGKTEVSGSGIPKNPLELGLNPILDIMLSVDFCNIITYALSKIPLTKKGAGFDPTKPPPDGASALKKNKYKLQKLAYDIQIAIDTFDSTSKDSSDTKKKGLFELAQKIKSKFIDLKALLGPEINAIATETGITPQTIIEQFPQIKKLIGGLEDKVNYLNRYSDYRQIPDSQYQKFLKIIDKVKFYCVLVQGLSSPADLLDFLPAKVDKKVQDDIQKVQKIIDPARAIPLIKSISQTCTKINLLIKRVLTVVSSMQLIIRLAILFIAIFKKIKLWLFVDPTPNAVTTKGITTAQSNVTEQVIEKKGIDNFVDRLSQLNILLSLIYNFCNSIALELEVIISKLKTLLANLQSCGGADKDLVSDLSDKIEQLQKSLDNVNRFIANKNNSNNTSKKNTAGEYTIRIITEEVVEPTFNLNRRYGIAINNSGLEVLSSTPTYASDDSIIIAEVKQLLASRGLIKSSPSNYSIEQQEIINEASSYLYDDDINWDTESNFNSELDSPNNEDDSVGIGLNSFINKLPGGKALRKRVRAATIKNNQQLTTELKKSDPEQKYSGKLIKDTEQNTAKLKIEQLEEEKKKIVASLVIDRNPITVAASVKRLKLIDTEIKVLKNG
jgi:hypothetical protein